MQALQIWTLGGGKRSAPRYDLLVLESRSQYSWDRRLCGHGSEVKITGFAMCFVSMSVANKTQVSGGE
jgi:hypothetical protein